MPAPWSIKSVTVLGKIWTSELSLDGASCLLRILWVEAPILWAPLGNLQWNIGPSPVKYRKENTRGDFCLKYHFSPHIKRGKILCSVEEHKTDCHKCFWKISQFQSAENIARRDRSALTRENRQCVNSGAIFIAICSINKLTKNCRRKWQPHGSSPGTVFGGRAGQEEMGRKR